MDDSTTRTATRFSPAPETQRQLRTALGAFGTGVTVVTAQTEDGPCGITANSFASVSLDPALVLWSVDDKSDRCEVFARAKRSAIHVLSQTQAGLAQHFAQNGFDFRGIAWEPSAAGTPLLPGCLTRFECETVAVHPGGDHRILVSRVTEVLSAQGTPLMFAGGMFGHFSPA